MKKLKVIDFKYFEYLIITCLFGGIAVPVIVQAINMNYKLFNLPFVDYTYTQYSLIFFACLLVLIDGIIILSKKIQLKFTKIEITLGVIMVCGLLSMLLASDLYISFWGCTGRLEGFITLMCYYIYFWSATLIKDGKMKRIMIALIVIFQLVHSVIAIFTSLGIINLYGINMPAMGFIGNQNFFATITVLMAGIMAGLFYFSKNVKKRLFYLVILGVFLLALLLASTMSALFGLGIMVIVFFVYLFLTRKTRQKDKTILSSWNITVFFIVIAIIGFFAINAYMDNSLLIQITSIFEELFTIITTGEISESSGTGRFAVWANAIKLIPYWPIFGVGVDSFGAAYYANFGLSAGVFYDKVHNEFLQVLITQGIPCFVAYITLYYFVLKDVLKKCINIYYKERNFEDNEAIYLGLFLAIIGYLGQAVFNMSILNVAPNFWVIMGIACGGYHLTFKKDIYDKPKFVVLQNGSVAELSGKEYYE